MPRLAITGTTGSTASSAEALRDRCTCEVFRGGTPRSEVAARTLINPSDRPLGSLSQRQQYPKTKIEDTCVRQPLTNRCREYLPEPSGKNLTAGGPDRSRASDRLLDWAASPQRGGIPHCLALPLTQILTEVLQFIPGKGILNGNPGVSYSFGTTACTRFSGGGMATPAAWCHPLGRTQIPGREKSFPYSVMRESENWLLVEQPRVAEDPTS